jgi:predicted outer membrane repeat protein
MRGGSRLVVLVEFLLWMGGAGPAHAQIYVDADASGATDGSLWADAYPNLQDALDIATGSDEIWIAEGTDRPDEGSSVTAGDRAASFRITGDQNGLKIYGGFDGTESRRSARDPGAHPVVLSGDLDGDDGPDSDGDGNPDTGRGENSYHVVVLDGGDDIGANVDANATPATVLSGVTVTGGNANDGLPDSSGGGLFCDGRGSGNECSPTLRGVVFTGNTANFDGGAIYNNGLFGTSSPQVTNTILWGNSASSGDELYNDAATPTLAHTIIEGGLGGISENNGSSTTDGLRLTDGSPALDAGTPDTTGLGLPENDLTGGPRVVDNDGDGTNDPVVDLGAYEASPSTVLPVELAGFEGAVTAESVRLTWQTASESGNAGFDVQRQREDKTWMEVGFVASQAEGGTTTEARSYRFSDTDIPYAADSLTYRLKQVDTDGSVAYTEAITMARSAVTGLQLLGTFPNPARGRATVRFAVPKGTVASEVRLRLYDVLGRQVRTVTAEAEARAARADATDERPGERRLRPAPHRWRVGAHAEAHRRPVDAAAAVLFHPSIRIFRSAVLKTPPVPMTCVLRTASLLFALLTLPIGTASAQIYVDADATGANDGSSWADAYTDLQAAIDNASGSSELWVAEGIYTPDSEGDSFTITGAIDGVELYGGFDGTETSRDQRAPKEHRTILSGDLNGDDIDPDSDGIIQNASDIGGDENANHVLFLDGTSGGTITRSTVLDGVTVTAGDADGAFPENIGGGLLCEGDDSGNECSPTLWSVAFTGNRASQQGGAVYNSGIGGAASPRIANARFAGNAAGDGGGALVNKGFNGGAADPAVTNTTFNENTTSGDGGAVFNSDASPMMANVAFIDNVADVRGGAIYTAEGTPSITNAVFAGNSAVFDGGAMYNSGGTSNPASPTITNATFFSNTAGREGGAIYNSDGGAAANPRLANTILWGNSAATGNEMYSFGSDASPTLSHTIVEGGTGSIVDESGASTTYLDDSGSGVSFANSTNLDTDPQFVDAATPTGPDGSIGTADDGAAIGSGSPAIDAGDPNALPSDAADLDNDGNTGEPLPIDLVGAARSQDGDLDGTPTVDIGAYELVVRAAAITSGGFGGLDRTFAATPGQSNQPIGLFRLIPDQSGAALTAVSVTPDNPGVTGVDRAALWISDDNSFEASSDKELASLDLHPQTDLPSPLTFEGFTEALPGQARYLFVTVTLTDDASGEVTGYLARETALALDGGGITEVNGNTGQNQFSNLPLSGDASPLPVEMASFDGTTTEAGVQLRWKTASEQNNAGFRILRKAGPVLEGGGRGTGEPSRRDDPTEGWQTIGRRAGAGTTREVQTYQFTDEDVPYAADSVSYRLKQVDTDGTASFTEPVTVARSGPEALELLGTAPNPARQRTTVRYAVPEGTGGDVRMRLYDVLGRRVRTVRAEAASGRHELQLDTSGLAGGVYFLRLTAGDATATQKLTVVR